MNPKSLSDSLPVKESRVLDAYYYAAKKCYLIPKEGKGWVEVNPAGLKLALRECGLSKVGEPLSPVDTFTHELHTQYDLDFAGALAGYRLGFYTINGRRILVTSQLQLPVAVKGDCPTIEKLFERWFGEEQLPYILGWLKHAYLNLLPDNKAYQPAQLLALCGEPGAGKNLFQDIVTEVLGGRVAKPYRYLSGNTQFNSDLTGAEHLQISDEVAKQDYATRRKFGAAIKDICVNNQQSIHAKGKEAINLPLRWRMTASLNDCEEDLCILPPYEPQLWEKITLIQCHHAGDLLPATEKRESFWQSILAEIPALCGYLLNYHIPASLIHPRYGITHHHNTELLVALDAISPELRLHDQIVETLFSNTNTQEWTGTATELENELIQRRAFEALRGISPNVRSTGKYLNRLEEKKAHQHLQLDVSYKRTNKGGFYHIRLKSD